MHHKRIGAALVTIAVIGACSHPRVETAAGDISTPAMPANARMLPTGTQLDVVLNQQLGTQTSHSGDMFSANVTNAVIAQNGRTTIPAGAVVWGHVTAVTPASNAAQSAALVLDFDSLSFNGRRYPFAANVVATNLERQRGTSTSDVAKGAGVGALAGAALGAVLGGADRDKILLGAGLGAVAGTAISLGRSGENALLPVGSHLSLQTTQSIALR